MLKGKAIGAEADNSEKGRSETEELAAQDLGSMKKLGLGELIGGRRGSRDDVGDPEVELEQMAVFGRMEEPRRKTGSVESRPESITGTSEMVTSRGAVEPGIDPAE